MLLEDDSREERGLETVSGSVADDRPEAAQRRPAMRLLVVRKPIEIALNVERCPKVADQASLGR